MSILLTTRWICSIDEYFSRNSNWFFGIFSALSGIGFSLSVKNFLNTFSGTGRRLIWWYNMTFWNSFLDLYTKMIWATFRRKWTSPSLWIAFQIIVTSSKKSSRSSGHNLVASCDLFRLSLVDIVFLEFNCLDASC